MVDKIKRISSRSIITVTALVLVSLFVLTGLVSFARETIAHNNGSLYQYTVDSTDLTWSGIEYRNGHLMTTDNDPQMIFEKQQKFTSLRFYMEASIYPGEMVVYYTEPGDAGFSAQKRLWITPTDETGWYYVETTMKNVTSLRVDPTMYRGNIVTFGDFIFNEDKTFADYFEITPNHIFNLVVYTGIISSVLKFLQEMLKKEID